MMQRVNHLRAALALTCLGLVAATGSILVASPAAAAQEETMSNEECAKALKDYVSKLDQQPEEELLKKAKEHCEDGDLKGAKGVIDAAPESDDVAAKCQKEVDAYVARYNIKPNRDAVAEAQRYCKKGDARSAIRVIGRPE